MTVRQIIKFFDNKDVSVISNKKFVKNPEDYPTFSICLSEDPDAIYSSKVEEFHVTKNQYSSILKGLKPTMVNFDDSMKLILNSTHDELLIKLQDIVQSIEFETSDKNESLYYNGKVENRDPIGMLDQLISLNYHDPSQVCFTRTAQRKTNSSRKKDAIMFDFTPLNDAVYSSAILKLYIHIPGQVIRGLHLPAFEMKLRELKGNEQLNVSVSMPYVSVLKKRPDAIHQCNKSLTNDDLEFKDRVIAEVGCIPLYWEASLPIKWREKPCQTSIDLSKMFKFVENPLPIFTKYSEPCNEVLSPLNVIRTHTAGIFQGLSISLFYTTEVYQEIRNEKDFGFEALWSGMGGFVGIFLGYSLLNVADLMDADWKRFWQSFMNIFRLTNVVTMIFTKIDHPGKEN